MSVQGLFCNNSSLMWIPTYNANMDPPHDADPFPPNNGDKDPKHC